MRVFAEPNTTLLIEATKTNHKGLLIPRSLVTLPDDDDRSAHLRDVKVSIMNDCDSYRNLKKGHIVGEADAIEEHSILDDSSELDRCLSGNTSIDRPLSDNDDKPSPCPSQPVSSNPDDRLSSDIDNLERCLSDELLQDVNAIPNPKIQQVSSVSSLDEMELQVPAHIRDLWRRSIDNLSFEESKILASTLTEYADIFSKDDMDLGCFSETEHHIDTGTTKPIRQGMIYSKMM